MRSTAVVSVLLSWVFVGGAAQASSPGKEPWVRFDAARLGVSFEHPESMQLSGFAYCGNTFLGVRFADGEPRQIFFRCSGTRGETGLHPVPGRRMQLAVYLGTNDPSWWLPAAGHHPTDWWRFGAHAEPENPLLDVVEFTTRGHRLVRRLAEDRREILFRVDGGDDRVIFIRGAIRSGVNDWEPMAAEEQAAFELVGQSVAFAAPRSPATEPCEDWTRWHGEGWSLCVPSEWGESGWPGLPQQVGPIPPTRLAFEETEQRFSLMTRSIGGGLSDRTAWEERGTVLQPIASAGTRGPFPAEADGERVTAGSWAHVAEWMERWEPTDGVRLVEARLFTNAAGQTGFLRVIRQESRMREGAVVGPLGRPSAFDSMRFALFAPGRIEHSVVMTAWYEHEEARRVFERIARSFVIEGEAVEPPADLPITR